jgi:hypothetical protein
VEVESETGGCLWASCRGAEGGSFRSDEKEEVKSMGWEVLAL